jgi:hypothetical protein
MLWNKSSTPVSKKTSKSNPKMKKFVTTFFGELKFRKQTSVVVNSDPAAVTQGSEYQAARKRVLLGLEVEDHQGLYIFYPATSNGIVHGIGPYGS